MRAPLQVLALPDVLSRPSLTVHWHSTAPGPSLLFARDCGGLPASS